MHFVSVDVLNYLNNDLIFRNKGLNVILITENSTFVNGLCNYLPIAIYMYTY